MGQATIITLNEIIITLLRIEDMFINTLDLCLLAYAYLHRREYGGNFKIHYELGYHQHYHLHRGGLLSGRV
uniref:Uncharacterized protein n=1 Tax=Glossina palpalis gambiensis TaxID=67801 RepID=A0A1B0BU69_9MUSC